MGFSLKGYVLEKPRVGASNSAYTSSPDNVISDSGAYSSTFGLDETSPGRVEYLTSVLVDGDLANAEFGWTKNESSFQRFEFDGAEQRFRPMQGSVRLEVGTVDTTSNTTRLKLPKPTLSAAIAPYRLAVGSVGSGTTVNIVTVATDGNFGSPVSGTVELSLATGNLHWNTTDLATTFLGQKAFFQRQTFYSIKESTGRIGVAGASLLLNPLPKTGQFPLVRFGFGLSLHPIERATEAAFSANPVQGTVEWALNTGLLKFNSVDLAANTGKPVYYEGVYLQIGLRLPRQVIGTISSPTAITGLPSDGADLVFRAVPTLLTGTATFSSTTTLVDGAASFIVNGVQAGHIVVLTSGPYSGARRAVVSVNATQLVVAPPFPDTTGANYKIEKGISQFSEFTRTTSFNLFGKSGQVQVNPSTGAVQFSLSDQIRFGAQSAEVIFGDLPIERGLALRLFRTPVDLAATSTTVKDVAAFYPTVGASLADPIVGAPMVFLPVAPIDDTAYPMTFTVEQGTGTFTGALARLDVPSPTAGLGYTIDFEGKQFNFAKRVNNEVTPIESISGSVQLGNPLVSNATLELDQGLGYTSLTLGTDSILEPLSGVVTFVETLGGVLVSSGKGVVSALTTLTDTSANFSGLVAGDQLIALNTASKGVYDVTAVTGATTLTFTPPFQANTSGVSYEVRRGKEILVDRYFKEVLLADPNTKVEKLRGLGAISNSPRLSISLAYLNTSRFRLALEFLTLSIVANDAAFTAPASLATGTVEISQTTGNLNFSQVDVATGQTVYWARKLVQGQEYRIEPELGFIQTTERLLALDELYITYSSTQDNPSVPFEERGTFLVRKELVVHPEPTSKVRYNPLGRSVAPIPPPSVFRGGRPQDGSQIEATNLSITFLPDVVPTVGGEERVTDALPHGEIVQPHERIYVDYFVYDAIGGENTTTVLKPPINLAKVVITEGDSTFKVKGDRTLDFPANYLLRIETEQAYYLSGSTYNATTDETTVTLLSPQVFRDSYTQPRLYLSSGVMRTTSAFLQPAYFTLESAVYDGIPRGMNRFRLQGDRTLSYTAGVALHFSQVSPSVNDFYLVSGSTYDPTLDRTEVVLTQSTARQYTSHTLRRAVRPLLEATAKTVNTSTPPAIPPPLTSILDSVRVFRRVEGQAGQILASPLDFTINNSGVVTFNTPLKPNEEFSIFYTRHRFIQPGQLRASYTASIAPNSTNGLENQVLTANFTALSPDSFYFRVETLTNFRGEVAKKYKADASASAPSSGPRVDNASQPKLYEQGQKSVYFDEGYLLNEDLVARASLKFYNDTVNFLEDLLRNMDGRVVGDYDGKLKFDGTTGVPVTDFSLATNQIDDTFKISGFPINFTPPLFPFKFSDTYIKAYKPNARSRFFPTSRNRYGYTVVGLNTAAETGAQMVDLGSKNITGTAPVASRRIPRARVVEAAVAGATVLKVDTTAAFTTEPGPYRPAFVTGMKVVVRDPSGAYLVTELAPSTVTVSGADTLTLAPGVVGAVPIGSTVHLGVLDSSYQKNFRIGFDVGLDAEKGYLLYTKPFFPYDGTVPAIPPELRVQDVNSQELLQTSITVTNSSTEPEKFPCLLGKAFDDDGDQRLPLINPSYLRETAPLAEPGTTKPAYLNLEQIALSEVTTNAVNPFTGVGTLNVAKTVITNPVNFPSPVPQKGDLVRITSGLNGVTDFRRVSATTLNTLTVDVPFSVQDTGFNYLVTTAANLITGTLTVMVGAVVTDALANFVTAGVKPGQTIVLTEPGHLAELERRQVLSVTTTQLTLTAPFSSLVTPATYRVHNPVNTYSTTTLGSNLTSQIAILSTNSDSELNSIDNTYNQVFTDRLSPTVASGTATAANTLVGVGVDFLASKVAIGDFVYVQPGQANEGIYTVGEVVNSTTLKISESPGFTSLVGLTFRVAKSFGLGGQGLKDLFDVRKSTATYLQAIQTWDSLVTTPVNVLVPPGTVNATYFARAYTLADFTSRSTAVTNRKTYLDNTGISTVEKVLSSGDRLYDARFAWIDARVNLEKGIIVKQERAVSDRLKAQAETLKQLIKLLTVEEGT